jgi:hypothetical protein
MSCEKLLPVTTSHVSTSSTSTWTFLPTSEWMLATGLDAFKAVVTMRSSTNLVAHAAYQTAATRTDSPDDWTTGFASDVTAEGAYCTGDEDITSATEADFYVRFGVAYKVAAGQSFGEGDLAMQTSFDLCGRLVGAKTFEVNITTTNTYDRPITEWMPAQHVNAVKYALLATGVETSGGGSNLYAAVIVQTATTSIEVPGAWATLDGAGINAANATNAEGCTGELIPALTSVMWVRFGVRTYINSGSKGIGTISAAIAVRS